MKESFLKLKSNRILQVVSGLIGIYVLYLLTVGLVSSTCPKGYVPPEITENTTDRDRALILADATTFAIDTQLNSTFGWIPNDLFFVPSILDNIVNYQKGVIYATRPASDIIAKTISRYGKNDTMDQRLVDATSRYFVYADDVWGYWWIYDTEGKYKQGVQNWKSWALSVDTGAKNSGVYNVKSDDVYLILKYCNQMLEYSLGYLNKDKIKHFESDNYVYFAKGVVSVVENILKGLVAVDSSVISRGGAENVTAALKRLEYVREFNPMYVAAGGNDKGDAMFPNHVASIARHIDVASNRINDIMQSMEK